MISLFETLVCYNILVDSLHCGKTAAATALVPVFPRVGVTFMVSEQQRCEVGNLYSEARENADPVIPGLLVHVSEEINNILFSSQLEASCVKNPV